MDKNIVRANYAIDEELSCGSVKIADDVVSKIASLATSEVEGVSSLGKNIGNSIMSAVGYRNSIHGVKVYVNDGEVRTDLAIVVEMGYNIPKVSAKVQEKVSQAIETMTNLKVTDVNVRVVGVKIQGK